jgi:hypothetical protein
MTIDTQKLRRLAGAATQEKWEVKYFGSKVGFRFRSGYQFFIDLRRANQACSDEAKATARFLESLDPPTILSLLDRLERAERDAERYQFIRTFDEKTHGVVPGILFDERDEMLWGVDLDAAVDTAMAITRSPSTCVGCGEELGKGHKAGCKFRDYT